MALIRGITQKSVTGKIKVLTPLPHVTLALNHVSRCHTLNKRTNFELKMSRTLMRILKSVLCISQIHIMYDLERKLHQKVDNMVLFQLVTMPMALLEKRFLKGVTKLFCKDTLSL